MMSAEQYLRSYNNYFWEWDDDENNGGIPNYSAALIDSTTILYESQLNQYLEPMVDRGFPPFASLLISIYIANRGGPDILKTSLKLSRVPNKDTALLVAKVLEFCEKLAAVSSMIEAGRRKELICFLFKDAHGLNSPAEAQNIVNQISRNLINWSNVASEEDAWGTIYRDLMPLARLNDRYESTEDLLKAFHSTTEVEISKIIVEGVEEKRLEKYDYFQELIESKELFHMGALIKNIWSGLKIKLMPAATSDMQMGGFSDIVNKGDMDKLLLSEFAYDDLIILSRLANHESLYFKREQLLEKEEKTRIFIIDTSLTCWGTPHTLEMAVTIAIAKHPRSKLPYRVFGVGEIYAEIDRWDEILINKSTLQRRIESVF
jgi:hypothetical protein